MDTGTLLANMATALNTRWQPAAGEVSDWPLPCKEGDTPFWAAVALILGQGDPSPAPAVLAALQALSGHCLLGKNPSSQPDIPARILAVPERQLFTLLGRCGKRTAPLRRFCFFVEQSSSSVGGDALDGLEGSGGLFETLLQVKGLGLETVESLLLHVFCRPVFPAGPGVYRIALRHGIVPEEVSREEVASVFVDWLGHDIPLLQSMHRHLRLTAASFCKVSSPACLGCPLEGMVCDAFE